MDPHQRPQGTPHHWTLRNALHQATPSFAGPTLAVLRGPSAHWHSRASPALAQESEGNCQDEAGPETTSVRTSQQIKAMMLLRRASGRRRWAKKACRQAFAVWRWDEQFNPAVFKRKAYLWLSCRSQPSRLYRAAALATREKTDCSGYFETLWNDASSHHKPHRCIFQHYRPPTPTLAPTVWDQPSGVTCLPLGPRGY